jgi:hypothetical protein
MKVIFGNLLLLVGLTMICCESRTSQGNSRTLDSASMDNSQNSAETGKSSAMYPDSLRPIVESAYALEKYLSEIKSGNAEFKVAYVNEFPASFHAFNVIFGNYMYDHGLPELLSLSSEEHVALLSNHWMIKVLIP